MQHRNGFFSYILLPDTPLPNSSPYIVWCVPSTYQGVLYCSSHCTVYSGWTNFRLAGTQQLPFLQNCFFLPSFTHILPHLSEAQYLSCQSLLLVSLLTCKHQSLTPIFVPHLKIVFLEDMNQALCLILL